MIIYESNRPCESCKIEVKEVLDKPGLIPVKVNLYKIESRIFLTNRFRKLKETDNKKIIIDYNGGKKNQLAIQIKKVIFDYVYNMEDKPNLNFSSMISKELNYTYAYLANFFSEFEAITIEQYMINLKIERVKELIMMDEFNFSEIAYKLHYSSVAHLSNQFKKVTGLTPSLFKSLRKKRIEANKEIVTQTQTIHTYESNVS